VEQLQTLCDYLGIEYPNSRSVAARVVETDDKSALDRVAGGRENDEGRPGDSLFAEHAAFASKAPL
jgi:hypothetical protein